MTTVTYVEFDGSDIAGGTAALLSLGLIATDKVVWTGNTPPLSCIVDGIQISSGCTYGKGNISVKDENIAKADFSANNGKQITILLNPQIREEIESKVNEDNLIFYSEKMFEKSDD